MGLLSIIDEGAKEFTPSVPINTGTMYDLMTGSAIRGVDGKWIISGGLTNSIMGVQGRGNTYKSTCSGSFIARALGIYKDVEGLIVDSEDSISKDIERVQRFAGEFSGFFNINECVRFLSGGINDIGTVFEKIRELCESKHVNRKEYLIETPYVNILTGKPVMAWLPTIVFIDTYSEMFSIDENMMLEEGLDDKKNKTIYLVDGNKKTMFIRALRRWCEQYGLYVIATAHTGDNTSIDSYGPVAKQLQYMKQSDKLKNVGSKFDKLTIPLVQTMNPTILVDSDKSCMYPNGDSTPNNDINEVILMVQRCKKNIAGLGIPFVVSQSDGLLNSVTNYHYLKSNNYFGLNGSKIKHQPTLLPDTTVSRNTIRRQESESYELRRALDITAQYCYIKQHWNTGAIKELDFSLSPNELYDKLNSNGVKWNDILNSRGHWVYSKECAYGEREYLSVFDVVELLNK